MEKLDSSLFDLEKFKEYFQTIPFDIYRNFLYTYNELYDNYEIGNKDSLANCLDTKIYNHAHKLGLMPLSYGKESLARQLHDYGIVTRAVSLLDGYPELKVIGIMGGHEMLRDSQDYKNCAYLAKQLAEKGYFIITGGGPGAMEAAHLGVYMSHRDINALDDAIEELAQAPHYTDDKWLDLAFSVLKRFKHTDKAKSMAIPTWFYGHEPPAVFPTFIAKLFDNAIREHLLLIESLGGTIIFPGSAGTIQEVFQKNTFNHYGTLGYSIPMIFYNKAYWENDVPIIPFYEKMLKNGSAKNILLNSVDTIDEVIDILDDFSNIYDIMGAKPYRKDRAAYSLKKFYRNAEAFTRKLSSD